MMKFWDMPTEGEQLSLKIESTDMDVRVRSACTALYYLAD
jgi:hypothetical protein